MPVTVRPAAAVALLLFTIVAFNAGSAVAAPGRAPSAVATNVKKKPKKSKRHAKRCGAGMITLRQQHGVTRCLRRRSVHATTPAQVVHQARVAFGAVRLKVRRGHGSAPTLDHVLSQHGINLKVVETALARSAGHLNGAVAAEARAHAADTFAGPTIDGWSTTIDARPGENGGAVTVTAKRGEATVSSGYGRTFKIDTCPDSSGDVTGTRTMDITFDVHVQDPKKGSVKLHLEAKTTGKVTGHITDDLKVKDFDVDPFAMYMYVSAEVRDAGGRLIYATPPYLPNLKGSARGLRLGHTSVDDINATGAKLDGFVPSDMAAKAQRDFMSWAQTEFLFAVHEANELLTRQQNGGWDPCLDLTVTAAKTTLAPGESTTITVGVAPRHGPGFAPGHITGDNRDGTLAPKDAPMTGDPIAFTFTAPTSGWSGTEIRFKASSRQGEGFSGIALAAEPPKHFVLVFTHASRADDTHSVNSVTFTGTSTHHEAFGLTATIPLSGDPAAGPVSGSGPITYSQAAYHDELDGTFNGQGTCHGTDATDLTATEGGTARVLDLSISGTTVRLDFVPGTVASSGYGPPQESYHNVQSYDACPGADNLSEQALFLNRFSNQYSSAGWVYGTNQHLHMVGNWQPGSGDVVATLDVTGPQSGFADSSYADHYEIDRVP